MEMRTENDKLQAKKNRTVPPDFKSFSSLLAVLSLYRALVVCRSLSISQNLLSISWKKGVDAVDVSTATAATAAECCLIWFILLLFYACW